MTALERLAKAIDYPAPVTGPAAVWQVDGGEVRVTDENGRLRLERTLCHPAAEDADETLARFAGYAAGRLLKEEAVLAWDPRREELVLWQDVADTVSDTLLTRFFELFMTSCDWWLARTNEAGTASPHFPEMMILP